MTKTKQTKARKAMKVAAQIKLSPEDIATVKATHAESCRCRLCSFAGPFEQPTLKQTLQRIYNECALAMLQRI